MSSPVGADARSSMSRHLRERLATGRATPGTVTVHGAVLLSDIVGFTSHIEAMSGLGRSAIERFSLGMGSYIDTVINLVHEHGGDVLDIAGDSLLCLWEATDDPDGLRDVARAATDAAMAVQASVHGHPLGHGRTLETRIGICVGPVTLTVAGGVGDAWELLTQGETVERVEEAERACAPGAVAVDGTVAELVRAASEVSPIGGGLFQVASADSGRRHPPLPRSPTSLPVDQLPVDQPSANQMWAMDVRNLSVVMASVPELASGPVDRAHRVLSLFQTVVGVREGITKVVNDNKGIRLLAIFGAPPRAHEDDAIRAVDACRAFAEALRDDGATCSAGIATGRAVYGVAGNATRRATTLAGDVINVAARLSTTAQGNVLCDQQTAVGAQSRYSFTVLNPIIVKGKAQPVPVFEPVGEVTTRRRGTATVRGRAAELDRLAQLSQHPAPGAIDAAVVVGPAGLGKSTLLDDFVEQARRRGEPVVAARADAIDRHTPFLAWSAAVGDVLGIRPGEVVSTHELIVERSTALLDPTLALHAPVLARTFGGLTRDGLGAVVDAEPSTVIPQLVAALITAGGQRPLVVFEDAHWADAGSLAVLAALRRLPDRPSIVVSTRPEGLTGLDELTASSTTDVIELEPLGAEVVSEMIVDRLGTDRVPRELVEFVNDRVAGHPYFCEQLLKSLVESGTVVVNGPVVTLGDLDRAALPSTVEGVIVSRLDRFSGDAQQCLKAASVIGRRHDVATMQACLPALDVAGVLDRMGSDGLLRRVDATTFEFQHVIARDVVYDVMTDQQRAQLHRIVADHLERAPGGAGAATIGRHWRRAGEPSRAVRYLEQAVSDALGAGSFSATIALLDEIDEIRGEGDVAMTPLDRARLALQRARACYYLGLLRDARTELEGVISVLAEPLPTSDADHLREHERLEHARATPIAVAAEDIDAEKVLFETYRTLVKVLYMLGESGHAIVTVALRSLASADRLGRPLEAAAVQAMLCGAYCSIGDIERFELHSRAAIRVAESPEGAAVANHVWRMLAVAFAALGRWSASIDVSDRALAALDPEGQNRDAGIWQTRAAVHLCAGQFAIAEQAWRRTRTIAERDGNQRLARWSRLDEVQTLVGLDRIDDADAVLTDIAVELGPPTDPLGTIEQHYTTAIVRSAQGRHVEAVRHARHVVRMVEEVPPSGFHWVEFCSGAAEAMLAALFDPEVPPAVDPEELIPEVEHVIELLDGFAGIFVHVAPRVPLARALLALACGRDAEAAMLLRDAERLAREGSFEFDAARCVVVRRWFGLDDDRAGLEQARAALAELGARRWVARADAILDREPAPTADR